MEENNPYQASQSTFTEPVVEPMVKQAPQGIGGWLILVLISLVLSPLRSAAVMVTTYLPLFSNGSWALLTTPGNEAYNPLWQILLPFEIVVNLCIGLFALINLYFFLRKSSYTPRLIIGWHIFALVFVTADIILARQIPAIAQLPAADTYHQIMVPLFGALIWVPYFVVSKRVKATFVKKARQQ